MAKDAIDMLLDTILDSIFDEKWVGRRGEKLTERKLRLVSLFGRKGKTLRNVYIPKENGETSEIDVMYITQKGIFVFESKNYSGWIFGDESRQNWTMSLPNKQEYQFYNPIMQNRTHIKWLQKYVGDNVPLFSIIVFSERCELKKVTVRSGDVRVIKRDETYWTVREIWEASPDRLSESEIEALYESLKKLTNVDESVKAAHIQDIKRKYYSQEEKDTAEPEKDQITPDAATDAVREADTAESEAAAENEAVIENEAAAENEAAGENETNTVVETNKAPDPAPLQDAAPAQEERICPRCGKPMVLRTAKKGSNAGKQFYGCSGFPACRFMQSL